MPLPEGVVRFVRCVGGLDEPPAKVSMGAPVGDAQSAPSPLSAAPYVIVAWVAGLAIGVMVGMDVQGYLRGRRARENWMRAGMPQIRAGMTPEEWECEWGVQRGRR